MSFRDPSRDRFIARLLDAPIHLVLEVLASADRATVEDIDRAESLGLGRLTVRRHALRRRRELDAADLVSTLSPQPGDIVKGLNKVYLIGPLVSNPDRHIPLGPDGPLSQLTVTVTLATPRSMRSDEGQWVDIMDVHNIVFSGRNAEFLLANAKEGNVLAVEAGICGPLGQPPWLEGQRILWLNAKSTIEKAEPCCPITGTDCDCGAVRKGGALGADRACPRTRELG